MYQPHEQEELGCGNGPQGGEKAVHRQERFKRAGQAQVWAMDIGSDQLSDGQCFRSLMVANIDTRESLAIESGQSRFGAPSSPPLSQKYPSSLRHSFPITFPDNVDLPGRSMLISALNGCSVLGMPKTLR